MKRVLWFGAALAVVGATPVAAQATIGIDVGAYSSYVWRGLTYTNKPVIEPDVYVTFPIGSASLTVGGWANIDAGKYGDANNDLSESGGASAFNLAEFDWWGELGYTVSKATLTAGVTGYLFPNDANACTTGPCYTKALNTTEIYGKVALSAPLNPKVSAYYDINKVKGLYVEASVSHGIPLGPKSLTIGALAGWTGGQEVGTDKSANFNKSGLTHVDLSASIGGLSAGSLSITPAIHGIIGHDDWTKITKPTALDTKFKIWGGLTLSWSKSTGASEEKSE